MSSSPLNTFSAFQGERSRFQSIPEMDTRVRDSSSATEATLSVTGSGSRMYARALAPCVL